jgi:hypothetical protein
LNIDLVQGHEFDIYFENQYKLMFADFGAFENRDFFTVALLILATILVPLVFLNLLIALISDAFAVVSENLVRSDFAELTDIILELEEFMFWNADKNKATHLVVAQQSFDNKVEWAGRGNKVANKVKNDLDKQEKNVLQAIK